MRLRAVHNDGPVSVFSEGRMIVKKRHHLRKYFLDVSQDRTQQRRRFEARIKDPVKHMEALVRMEH